MNDSLHAGWSRHGRRLVSPVCQASEELQDAALGISDQDTGSYPISDIQVMHACRYPSSVRHQSPVAGPAPVF